MRTADHGRRRHIRPQPRTRPGRAPRAPPPPCARLASPPAAAHVAGRAGGAAAAMTAVGADLPALAGAARLGSLAPPPSPPGGGPCIRGGGHGGGGSSGSLQVSEWARPGAQNIGLLGERDQSELANPPRPLVFEEPPKDGRSRLGVRRDRDVSDLTLSLSLCSGVAGQVRPSSAKAACDPSAPAKESEPGGRMFLQRRAVSAPMFHMAPVLEFGRPCSPATLV